MVFFLTSSYCVLQRDRLPKKSYKDKPYAITHRIIALPDSHKPTEEEPKYIYLLRGGQELVNFKKAKRYEHSLTSQKHPQLVKEHLKLEMQSNGDLALNLVKPIAGQIDLSLNVDLIYRKRILHRTIVSVYVDEKVQL